MNASQIIIAQYLEEEGYRVSQSVKVTKFTKEAIY